MHSRLDARVAEGSRALPVSPQGDEAALDQREHRRSRVAFLVTAWTADHRTGGPLHEVLDAVRAQVPWLVIQRLTVTHPADDDNVYFLGDAEDYNRVQVDTSPSGQPPFLIEGTQRLETSDKAEAIATIVTWLSTEQPLS